MPACRGTGQEGSHMLLEVKRTRARTLGMIQVTDSLNAQGDAKVGQTYSGRELQPIF